MKAPNDDEEPCSNCNEGRYSTRDAHGEMREYECNWCDGTGKQPRTTSARPSDE